MAEELHAVHHRHVEVGHDDVERAARELAEGLLAVRRRHDAVPLALEDLGEGPGHVGLVLDEQDALTLGDGGEGAHGAVVSGRPAGSSMMNVVPTFGVLRTWMSP
jgi:hypothetical protein